VNRAQVGILALIVGAFIGAIADMRLAALLHDPVTVNVQLDVAPVTQAGDRLACLPILKPAKAKP